MLASDLITKVVEKSQDGSYSTGDILALINEGRQQIAGDVDLPAQITSSAVSATSLENFAALPDDYHKGLYWVVSEGQKIRIGRRKDDYYDLASYYAKYPVQDITGSIADVVVEGGNLLYHPMADDTLTLKYFKKVEDIAVGEEPAELPPHLHVSLLVNYALMEIFDDIEDETEGPKANTLFHAAKFERAVAKLRNYVEPMLPREPVYVEDMS